jgi:hypothetical protein
MIHTLYEWSMDVLLCIFMLMVGNGLHIYNEINLFAAAHVYILPTLQDTWQQSVHLYHLHISPKITPWFQYARNIFNRSQSQPHHPC